jgi:hypothetical protein
MIIDPENNKKSEVSDIIHRCNIYRGYFSDKLYLNIQTNKGGFYGKRNTDAKA